MSKVRSAIRGQVDFGDQFRFQRQFNYLEGQLDYFRGRINFRGQMDLRVTSASKSG
jgi:hypothetical protein